MKYLLMSKKKTEHFWQSLAHVHVKVEFHLSYRQLEGVLCNKSRQELLLHTVDQPSRGIQHDTHLPPLMFPNARALRSFRLHLIQILGGLLPFLSFQIHLE